MLYWNSELEDFLKYCNNCNILQKKMTQQQLEKLNRDFNKKKKEKSGGLGDLFS